MESSTKDQAQGMFHRVKGKIRELFGKAGNNTKIESEGKGEKMAGKIQQKVGEVEKVAGK
jgi:uncharacterized protein YjbJ (UPF0337 family)